MKGKKFNIFGTALIGLAGLVNSVNANKLVSHVSPIEGTTTGSTFTLYQHSLGSVFDTSFSEGFAPALDMYHINNFSKWADVGRSAENMDTMVSEISGRGLGDFPIDGELSISIDVASFYGSLPEENMINKEMTRNIYDCKADPCGVLINSYDTKALDKSGMTIPLEVQNGLSYKVEDSFAPNVSWIRSDANRDGTVDLNDFKTLGKFYGKECSSIVNPQDCYDCFSIDTNDDGIIDFNDTVNLADDWLQGE